ncbi:capreomycidine synthase [Streptomyces sp. NPDC046881]|uniref:capreomycidine synthase n=1 Tax=Streptomyces sp. NPDC046881 TaxID=3155374 RepID=UPI0033CE2BEE
MAPLRTRQEDPPILEEWYRRHLPACRFDISSSGVHPYSFAEVREMCALAVEDLDDIVMDDSVSEGGAGIRQAIADRYCAGDADRVLVTHGSSEAIALTLDALLRPGDRVVVQESIYHSLGYFPRQTGCRTVPLPAASVRDGEIDPDTLARLVTPDTAAVIVNFPHNPSGRTLSQQGLDALLARVEAVGAVLVWDGAAAEIAHRWEPLPDPATRYERTVTYGTFSKTFGLPGLRVGWAITSPELLRATFPLRDRTTLFLSPLVELIAEHAMRHADRLIGRRAAEARRNLAHLTEWAARHSGLVDWTPPEGGVCCLLGIRELATAQDGTAVEEFCRDLLAAHKTLLVPGSAFDAPRSVRLGFGGPEADFRTALEHLAQFLGQRSAGSGRAGAQGV